MSINAAGENAPLLSTSSSVLFGTVASGAPYSQSRAALFESISTPSEAAGASSSALPPMPGQPALYRSVDLHASVTGRDWLVPTRPRLDSNMVRLMDTDRGETLDLGVHEMPFHELGNFLRLEINPDDPGTCGGLTEFAAQERLGIDGLNILSPPKKTPEWLKYIHCYLNFFMGLLFVAGVISVVLYAVQPSEKVNLWLGVILFGIIVLTATMEYFQNRAASNIMAQIAGLVSTEVIVRRDGSERTMDPKQLVMGDVIRLRAGDRVPADVRLLSSNSMKVDNASLTGEAEPQLRSIESTSSEMLETANVAFSGTLVTNGEGVGVVIASGDGCMIGQIASLAGSETGTKTPLEVEIEKFVRLIGAISATLAVILVILGITVAKESVGKAGYNAVGILVANVPQGLPATVAISLFLAAKRLRQANVVVKTLQQVETLGSVSVICSDKTGTLTQNRMTASNAWTPAASAAADTLVPLRLGDSSDIPAAARELFATSGASLLHSAVLCSRSNFEGGSGELRTPEQIEDAATIGDATESGFLRLVAKATDYAALRAEAPKVFEIPFNSVNKFQLSIHDGMRRHRADGVDRVLYIKGAPEVIVGKSATYVDTSGALVPVDDDFKARFSVQYEALGRLGERVLAFAQLPLGPETGMADVESSYFDLEAGTVPLDGLEFLGLLSLIDPPKFTVPGAVDLCSQGGIKVIMMTGDHVTTAEAIGRQVGIITGKTIDDVARERGCPTSEIADHEYDAVVVHGSRIDSLTEPEWDAILSKRQIVFGRLSPMHKVDIVQNNQRLGGIVAVTGDGVNDAPSLKIANVGIAMGISGSEVSKDAADIILLDDDFSSIVLGVRVGRVILDNLRKSSTYIVTHLSAELVPVVINILFGIPLGLQSLQMLLIDLGTEIIPGVALSFETAEADVMQRPPRRVSVDRMMGVKSLAFAYVQAGTLQSLGCIFAFIFTLWHYGNVMPHELWQGRNNPKVTDDVLYTAQAAWFTALVVQQCCNLISMRTRSTSVFNHPPFSNSVIFLAWVYSLALAALMIYIPGLNDALYFRAFPLDKTWYWLLGIPGGIAIMIYAEFCKLANRRKWAIGRYIGF